MSFSCNHKDSAPDTGAGKTGKPASATQDRDQAAQERVQLQQYLEALRNGITLSS